MQALTSEHTRRLPTPADAWVLVMTAARNSRNPPKIYHSEAMIDAAIRAGLSAVGGLVAVGLEEDRIGLAVKKKQFSAAFTAELKKLSPLPMIDLNAERARLEVRK